MNAIILSLFTFFISCNKGSMALIVNPEPDTTEVKYKLPNIDLSHWKVTLPIGPPLEISPPEIEDYATNDVLRPYMYNDSINGALVFFTTPGNSTANSSYSRTELREQMVPGSNSVNWTFALGGNMKGTLSMGEISKLSSGYYPKVIIMQIHGRLTDDQRDLIGAKDNNAPPVLKIYWENGKIKVAVKQLKNINVSDIEILDTDSWKDLTKYFSETVNFDKFSLEVDVKDGKLSVTLNNKETFVYDDIHMQRWGVFENYFKAGNYLNTLEKGAFARVKYYELSVSH